MGKLMLCGAAVGYPSLRRRVYISGRTIPAQLHQLVPGASADIPAKACCAHPLSQFVKSYEIVAFLLTTTSLLVIQTSVTAVMLLKVGLFKLLP